MHRTFDFREIKISSKLQGNLAVFALRYNTAPWQEVPVISNNEKATGAELFQGWLVPSWPIDASLGNKMFNAGAFGR
jgi:putative SOS response-associated peptidase YedK